MDACHQTRNRRDSLNSGQLFRGPENARRVCMRWSHVVEQNKLGHLFESEVLRLMRVMAYTRLFVLAAEQRRLFGACVVQKFIPGMKEGS